MKKIISLVLALTMLCSMIAIPVSAETDRESLLEREVQYIDIISTARAGDATPAFRDSFKKDASLYHLTNPSVFTQNRTDTTYHEILNTMWIGFGYKGAAFTGTNQTLHFFDLTDGGYEILATDTNMGSRARTIDTDGVISYEAGDAEEYEINYYKFGNYKIGPVSVEDDDATTDVFYSPNSVYLGGNSEGASLNSQTFEDLNVKGKYLNILLNTFEFEGDASIIPVKIDYTTGDAETFYVFTTQNKSEDRLSTLVKVLPKKAEGEYTQQELVDNKDNFVYLTSEKREELGITAEDIDEITFDGLAEDVSLIFPEKVAMRFCNRNVNGAEAKDAYIEDITLPLDSSRTVSKVTITSWFAASDADAIVAPHGERLEGQKTTTYHKLTIPGYEGDNEFYALFGRTCQKRSVLLGMSVLSENDAEKIAKINEKIEAIDVDTITREECDALRLEIAELKAANADIVDADFNTAKLDQAEEKLAEADRIAALQKREMYYYPVEYNRDAFFTVAEAFEFGVFDTVLTYPEKDLAGNPLDTVDPWFGYKGFVRSAPGTSAKNSSGFLIDSIKGVEGQVIAQRYKSSTDYTIINGSKKLVINGNPNFELQSTDANGAENYIYNADGFKYKLGPIGGSAHRTADGGYNVRALGENEVLKFERVQDGAKKFGMLLASKQNNEGVSYASLQKVEITYNDGKDKETKYLVVTNMAQDADSDASTTYDGDRLGRLVVAVPKKDSTGADLDHTSGAVLKANAKIVSEKTSLELIGKAITVDDVVFPADFVVGKSMPIADFGIGRNAAVTNGKRYCPGGYANHYELDFGEDVTAIEYKGSIGYGKAYPGAILNSQVAYIPVTIEGASEDYLYYARFGRPCGYFTTLLAASSMGGSLEDRIVEVNAQLEVAETKEEIISALDAVNALIDAGEGSILAKDFNTASAVAKLATYIKEDIATAESVADIEAIEAEIDAYLVAFGSDTAALEAAIAEKLVVLERLEELSQGEKYDLVDIDWDYVDNSQYLINAFEMSSVASIESTTDYYASISGQSYINTSSTYEHITIAEALAEEADDIDGDVGSDGKVIKNFTGSGIGYSYYPTDKIQEKTGTFPTADGKYYITAPSGAKFEIKGVTNEVGANANNAGYVTYDDANKENGGSIYKVDFDGETPYNKVNLLVAGVSEPVWNGSPRQNTVAQANIYYADGSTESQLIIIPSVWGYVPTIAGKLKTQDEVSGVNISHPYVDANSSVLVLCSSDKFNWVPSNVNAEVFDFGTYMTTTFTNTAEERHTFKEMTNHAGALASVSVDTKGKAVDYVEIAPAEDEVLEAAGAFAAAKNSDTHNYWLPIANEDVLELVGEDKAGVLKNQADAKVSDCDFYLKVQRNAKNSGRGSMAVLFAANAEKKYENLLAYVKEATAAMESVSENSKLEEVFAANEIYENALAQEGIKESDFDANLVAKFKALIDTVKEKTDVKGVLEVKYFENAATIINVKLTNLAELEGKNFAVLLTYLDADGKVVGSKTFTGVSTAAKEETVTFEDENAPAGAVEVKAYLWKALGSLKPLGEAVVAKKSSYAVDRFFDVEEGEFKEEATGDLNILFLGDSLTEGSSTYEIDGENADRPDHWTNVIAMYMKEQLPSMKVNVLNGGIGGTTTSFQSPILDGYALNCEPDIVFIQNVNNYNSSSTKATVESVEAIVRSLLKLDKVPTIIYYHAYSPYTPADDGNTYPVTVQTNRTNETQEKHRDDIDALLAQYNIASLDYITYFRELTSDCTDEIMTQYYNEGNVHPKTAGYKLMGDFATAQFFIDASEFFKRNVLKAEANSDKADDVYKVTYPNDSRFAYKNFNIIAEADAAANDINKRQYAFPFKGNVAQARVGGAEITFETTAEELSIYYVNPTSKYRTNKVKIYVDGEFVRDGAGANPYASNYDNIKITGLDGAKHTIKLVTDAPSQHDSGSILDIFNFMFLAEKQ